MKKLTLQEKTRICKGCQQAFIYTHGHPEQQYCSLECSRVVWRVDDISLRYKNAIPVNGEYTESCIVCNKIRTFTYKGNLYKFIRRGQRCNGCARRGQKRTDEQRNLISKKTIEAMHTPEVWNRFICVMKSEEHREKKRIQFQKQCVNKNNNTLYNKIACVFFNKLNTQFGWNGQHAENGGEYCVGGFWLDYYEPTLNIAIEWDEKHHKQPHRTHKDRYREKYIMKKLNCNFYRIDEETMDIRKVECL